MSLTKISDYMQLSKEDRQKHIDLTTPCQFHYFEKDYNYRGVIKKAGDLYCKRKQIAQAKNELLKELGIEDFGGNKIHVCHLCDCCSTSDKVCVNPAHLYFGTVSENHFDIPFEVRSEIGKAIAAKMTKEQFSEWSSKGAKKAIENKTHNTLKKVKCPHCGKESNLLNIKQWHNDNCKFKPKQ